MDEVAVAVHTTFFIAGPCVEHRPMRQHGSALVGNVDNIAMAFLTLIVFKGGISGFTSLGVVVTVLSEMGENVPDAVKGLGIKEFVSVMGCGQMAIHAVGDKPLGIVHVGGCLPCTVSESDFVARSTKARSRGSDHGVIGKTEQGKSNKEPQSDIDAGFNEFFHRSTILSSIESFVSRMDDQKSPFFYQPRSTGPSQAFSKLRSRSFIADFQ